jgi:fatty-acyl-CoA synthase
MPHWGTVRAGSHGGRYRVVSSWSTVNLFTMLDQAAARFPARGALYHGERSLCTWLELRDRALRIATTIRAQHGTAARIAVASENRPEIVELMFAIWAAECVLVPINFKLHPREMAQIIDDAGASQVFASRKIAAGLAGITGVPLETVDAEGYSRRRAAPPAVPPSTDPSALAWLFYTSGTTGRSKGAMLTHRSLTAMTVAHLADIDNPDEECSLIHGAPMSHGSGLYVLPYVLRGARQVVPASAAFDPDEFLDLCAHHPGSSAFLAPTMVQRLVATGRDRPGNLRAIVYGGGPMYIESLKKAMAAFGPVFAQIYGQGESPMTITGLRRHDHETADDAILGSVGYARSGMEVAVLRADGTPADIGEVGEIVCRGDALMSGYWNNPAATADALRNGWMYTGDIGSFDVRGYLTLRDRSKDVVISGGSNIYPREVEEVLLEHPGVAEACVVGTPDAEWGEVVVAFVVGSAVSDELDAHLLARIARFKRPKRYVFVDELPKNSYGKVLKRELRDRLAEKTITARHERFSD